MHSAHSLCQARICGAAEVLDSFIAVISLAIVLEKVARAGTAAARPHALSGPQQHVSDLQAALLAARARTAPLIALFQRARAAADSQGHSAAATVSSEASTLRASQAAMALLQRPQGAPPS